MAGLQDLARGQLTVTVDGAERCARRAPLENFGHLQEEEEGHFIIIFCAPRHHSLPLRVPVFALRAINGDHHPFPLSSKHRRRNPTAHGRAHGHASACLLCRLCSLFPNSALQSFSASISSSNALLCSLVVQHRRLHTMLPDPRRAFLLVKRHRNLFAEWDPCDVSSPRGTFAEVGSL